MSRPAGTCSTPGVFAHWLLSALSALALPACADDAPATISSTAPPEQALLDAYEARFPVPTGPWTGIGELSAARKRLAPLERNLLGKLASDPGPGVDRELGRVYTLAAETARGAAFLVRALRSAPADGESWMWLGANRLSVGEVEDATVLLAHARELVPDDARVFAYIGETYRRSGDDRAARAAFERALELDPTGGDSHVALATLLEDAGELEAAREHLLAARETRPEDLRVAFRLARIARDLGREDEALEHEARHARLAALDDLGLLGLGAPAADLAAQLGIHLLTSGRYSEALVEFDRALELEPAPNTRINALLGRTWSLVHLERLEEARRALRDLRALAPGHPEIAKLDELSADAD